MNVRKIKVYVSKKSFNNAYKEGFVKAYRKVINDNVFDLSEAERYVFMYLLSRMNKETHVCKTSIKDIAINVYGEFNETKRKKIQERISRLKKKGLITVSTAYIYNPNSFHTTPISTYKINTEKIKGVENGWEKIPNSLMYSNKFDWKEKLFIIQLYALIHINSNQIRYSKSMIAKKLNVSYTKINRFMQRLKDKGILYTDENGLKVNFFKLFDISNEVVNKMIDQIAILEEDKKYSYESISLVKKENEQLENAIKDFKDIITSLNLSISEKDKYLQIVDRLEAEKKKIKKEFDKRIAEYKEKLRKKEQIEEPMKDDEGYKTLSEFSDFYDKIGDYFGHNKL